MATASDPAIRNQQKLLWTAVHRAFLALFGLGGFVHVLLALFNPDGYRDFSDSALFSWVHDGWQNVFMADPRLWALLVAAGEFSITALLVYARRWGQVAVIVFHVALMLFGWGFLAVERAGVGIRRTGDCAAVPIGVDSGGGTIESEGK